jgi:NADH-quinone oxidoreductase subunit M
MLSNFVGEFLVLQGAAIADFKWAVYASLGVILSACYMLWMYQRVIYGEVNPDVRSHMPDLDLREWAAVTPLLAMMVWMGVYSQSFLPPVSQVTAHVLEQTQVNVPYRVDKDGGHQFPATSHRPPATGHRPPFPEVANAR